MRGFAVSRVEMNARCKESGRTIHCMQSAHLQTPQKVRSTEGDVMLQNFTGSRQRKLSRAQAAEEERRTHEIHLQIPPTEGPQEPKGWFCPTFRKSRQMRSARSAEWNAGNGARRTYARVQRSEKRRNTRVRETLQA